MKNIVFIIFLAIPILSSCSFLYGKPAPPKSSSIIDVTTVEIPWEIPHFSGVNQDEKTWSTANMHGKWWLTSTIFTRCPTVCTIMTPNMVRLQEAIEKEGLDVQIVSFTVDPQFDTPERLKKYAESYGANLQSWDFITGYSEEELEAFVYEALKQKIIKYPERNDIGHPTRFYLVNPEGIIVRLYEGDVEINVATYLKDLKQLVNK